jgi:hypothetical protein
LGEVETLVAQGSTEEATVKLAEIRASHSDAAQDERFQGLESQISQRIATAREQLTDGRTFDRPRNPARGDGSRKVPCVD